MNDPTSCRGCKRLRYAPTHLKEPTNIIPAWSAPGQYVCEIFGALGPATHQPIPVTETCKERNR